MSSSWSASDKQQLFIMKASSSQGVLLLEPIDIGIWSARGSYTVAISYQNDSYGLLKVNDKRIE